MRAAQLKPGWWIGAGAMLLAAAAAACNSGSDHRAGATTTSTVSTPSTSAEAEPASVVAYRAFWQSYLAAFLLFRAFDIWKPPPVRQLEALPGGLGINADDAMAGFYAAVVLFAAGCFNLY